MVRVLFPASYAFIEVCLSSQKCFLVSFLIIWLISYWISSAHQFSLNSSNLMFLYTLEKVYYKQTTIRKQFWCDFSKKIKFPSLIKLDEKNKSTPQVFTIKFAKSNHFKFILKLKKVINFVKCEVFNARVQYKLIS